MLEFSESFVLALPLLQEYTALVQETTGSLTEIADHVFVQHAQKRSIDDPG